MSLISELKRRNVFRVAIGYAIISWLILQVADILIPALAIPGWSIRLILVLLLLGFPVALLLAWAFDLTPEGIKRAEDVDPQAPVRKRSPLTYAVIGSLLVLLSWFLYQQRPAEVSIPAPGSVAPGETVVETTIAGNDSRSITSTGTSIAVLPFVNMSADSAQEYFSDGISEELLNVLSRVPGLRVSSRTSAFAFKGDNRNIREIASILQVDHILEGSVRKAGNEVRITAQLIDTNTDHHIWSDTYDRELIDIFAIQDEISSAIVTSLQEALGLQKKPAISVPATTQNMDAYDLFLQATGMKSVLSIESIRQSVILLQQAVEIDPDFARAWIELAGDLTALPTWDHSLDMQEYHAKARHAVEQALEITPDDPDVYLTLAGVAAEEQSWFEWQQYLEKASLLDPGGRILDAKWLSMNSETWLGLGYLDKALTSAEAGLAQQPDNPFLHLIKAMALLDMGRKAEALAAVEKAILLGYAGGASDQVWEYHEEALQQPIWTATTSIYLLDHDPELLPLLPHIKRALFSEPKDHEIESRRFWQVARELGFNKEELLVKSPRWGQRLDTDLLAVLGEHEIIAKSYWGNSPLFWMWSPALQSFRRSEAFKSHVRDSGMLQFWREIGWPDLCRAVGEADFQCD